MNDYVLIPRCLIEQKERVSYKAPDWKPEDYILNSCDMWCAIHSAVIAEINNAGATGKQKAAQIVWDANNDGFVTVKGEIDVNGMASIIEFYVSAFLRSRAVVRAFPA